MPENTNKKTQISFKTISIILMIVVAVLSLALLSNQTTQIEAQTPGQIGSGVSENRASSLAAQASSLANQKAKIEAELKATELEKQAELIRTGQSSSDPKAPSQVK